MKSHFSLMNKIEFTVTENILNLTLKCCFQSIIRSCFCNVFNHILKSGFCHFTYDCSEKVDIVVETFAV